MAVLESCPKHNMVAYLEKTDGNTEFHEIISFLTRSSIHYALTVSPVVSTTFVEQFWMSAKSKLINNVRYITAKVAGKPVSILEASIRSDLLFDDADGIDSLPNQAIFDAIQLMGYEGDLTVLTFNKALFSPQWRFLFHTMNHCISSKSTSWDQIPTNIATAVICLTTNQKYNFSKLIFDGMMRHLDAKKKFVMYPRFISVFLDKQLKNVPVPLDHFPINALTSKVFSFMVKKGKHFSGNVTPLFDSMLVQPTEDEGDTLERQSEPQPIPSPPHLSVDQHADTRLIHSLDLTYYSFFGLHSRGCGGNLGVSHSNDRSLSWDNGGWHDTPSVLLMSLVRIQWTIIETEDAPIRSNSLQDVGERTSYVVHEEKESAEKGVSTEDPLSTAQPKVSTDKPKDSTDKPDEGTDKPKVSTDKERKLVPTDQMKLARDEKVVRKVQEHWEAEEVKKLAEEEATKAALSNEYDFIQARLNADKILAEKFKTKATSKKINKPPSRNQLRNQMMTYLKHVGGKKHSDLKTKGFEEIKALYDKIKRSDDSFIAIGSAEDEKVIKEMNEQVADASKKRVKKDDSIKGEIKEEEGTRKRKLGIRKKMKSKKQKVPSKDDEC
ncbi:hypothetical protein Tco_1294878 [Tanacetum coccineum]